MSSGRALGAGAGELSRRAPGCVGDDSAAGVRTDESKRTRAERENRTNPRGSEFSASWLSDACAPDLLVRLRPDRTWSVRERAGR